MKRCYLDSNFLVYLKDSTSLKHEEAANKISSLVAANYDLFISPLVLDEFLYVFKYALLKSRSTKLYQELTKAVKEILEIPQLFVVNPPSTSDSQLTIVKYMEKYKLSPRDAYHLLVMKNNMIDILATFDQDFKRVFTAGLVSLLV